MTITKVRLSVATGLIVVLLGVGAAAALAANAPETGVEASETATEPTETGVEAVGVGHEDPAGQNVDHQFEGVE